MDQVLIIIPHRLAPASVLIGFNNLDYGVAGNGAGAPSGHEMLR